MVLNGKLSFVFICNQKKQDHVYCITCVYEKLITPEKTC